MDKQTTLLDFAKPEETKMSSEPIPKPGKKEIIEIKEVPGLIMIKEFITKGEEQLLTGEINKRSWSHDYGRRRQLYGKRYFDSENPGNMQEGLPSFLTFLLDRLMEQSLFPERPTQAVINEYTPGQGISPHIDKKVNFGNEVAGISMGSDCVMNFSNDQLKKKVPVMLPRRSLIIFKDDARYKWKHGIDKTKKDKVQGIGTLVRQTRISVTLRVHFDDQFDGTYSKY